MIKSPETVVRLGKVTFSNAVDSIFRLPVTDTSMGKAKRSCVRFEPKEIDGASMVAHSVKLSILSRVITRGTGLWQPTQINENVQSIKCKNEFFRYQKLCRL